MKVINTSQSYNFVIVDDETYQSLKNKVIYLKKPNLKHSILYPCFSQKVDNGKWKHVYLHKFVLKNKKTVDHANGDTLDCRASNLRECTQSQNLMNTKKRINSKTKYKGVSLNRPGRKSGFRARINVNKKEIIIGYFESEKAAAIAYNIAAKKYFGEFARLNEID